jgi:glycosyltransferase involved in cell wall biosynthesis
MFMSQSSPKRIAFFMPNLFQGGAERVMLTLANQFATQDIQVDFILAKAKGQFLNRLSPKINVLDLQAVKTIFSVFRLAAYLRKQTPDVLFSTLHPSNIVALLAKTMSGTNVRIIVRVGTTVSAQRYAPWKKWFVRHVLAFCYSRVDQVVAVSNSVAADLQSYLKINPSKIVTIYNPTITDEFLEQSAEVVSHPWFQPAQPPVIIGAGRLIVDKGFADLISAFALVRASTNAKLAILGDGTERSHLELLAKELEIENDFSILGYVENPFAYMKRAALFVMPSLREGLPNVLIEAMACGCPVISTDCPGGAKEILNNGKYGDLIPVRDPKSLADAIVRNLRGDTKKVDVEWLNRFKLEYVARQYFHLLFEGII